MRRIDRLFKRATELQDDIEHTARRMGKGKYGRVLKMARQPTQEEYIKTVEITGLGILLLGGLGFTIYLIWTELPRYLWDVLAF